MARNVNAEERASATLVPLGEVTVDDDVEDAFNAWRDSFEKGEETGRLTAYEIPVNERGVAVGVSKVQTRLGSWPIDLYTFEELCALIINDWMVPTGQKLMGVRFVGSKQGEPGVRFNKIVMLRPPANAAEKAAEHKAESTASLLKAFQDSSERTLAMLQKMAPPKVEADPMAELGRLMQVARMLNEPTNQLLGQLLPALIGRGPADGGPLNGLGAVLDAAGKIAELSRGGGGDGGSDSDLVQVLRALVPVVKPTLEALPSILAARGPLPGAAPALPAPGAGGAGAGNAAPGAPGTPTAAPPPGPGIGLTDLPSGDAQVFAQLKPQIDALVKMAGEGADPAAAADLLFDQVILELDDAMYERVTTLLERPSVVSQMAVMTPAVGLHRPFFEAFRARIVQRIADEDAAASSRPTPT